MIYTRFGQIWTSSARKEEKKCEEFTVTRTDRQIDRQTDDRQHPI